jgi:hypothetical protein
MLHIRLLPHPKPKELHNPMTGTKKTTDLQVIRHKVYGVLIRLGLSLGLLALALALAARFS